MAPLVGPATGAPKWFPYLEQFLSSHPRVALATLHRYPLQLCYVRPSEPNYPTIANLLSTAVVATQANSVIPSVRTAAAHGVPLRIDEMNTISCGVDSGVAQSFASALWALDAVFQMARVGVDGVNIHTYPGATYELFNVHPRTRALAGHGLTRVLRPADVRPGGAPRLAPAERDRDQHRAGEGVGHAERRRDVPRRGHQRRRRRRAPSWSGWAKAGGAGTLERLEAPRLTSRGGVTLGGQSFGGSTTTGLLAGKAHTESVAGAGGQYVFRLPGGSAALLTVPPS